LILDENEAKRLLEKINKISKADSVTLNLNGKNTYNLRFAVNSITTNGFADSLSLNITSNFGKKKGSVTADRFDDESIAAAVKKSEDIAMLSPDGKEFMPPLSEQLYLPSNNFHPDTESLSSDKRAFYLSNVIEKSVKKDVVAAGYFEDETAFSSVFTSTGLFAYNKRTMAGLSATVRTKDGTGSGRFDKGYVNINNLEYDKLSDWVIDRSFLSRNPVELKPGRYTVILEASAAADMAGLCINFMNARQADEGRSYFSKPGGGNMVGEEMVNKSVFLYSDPTDPIAPSVPFNSEGLPRNKVIWFDGGKLVSLHSNRYWAEKTSKPIIAFPSNVVLQGTDKSLEQMISETDYAILVTRFWYIRTVDPKTMLVTGLTRDGVFEIMDGKINRPVKNFRFNESPINVFKNVIDIGKSEKASTAENDNLQFSIPPMKVTDFNFSSLSDAI
jgi:predicted Zn-dependent protease